jgi:hypothetical protein
MSAIYKEKTKKQWENAYKRAIKVYGNGQFLLDIPSKAGTMSFTYFNNYNKTFTIFYR